MRMYFGGARNSLWQDGVVFDELSIGLQDMPSKRPLPSIECHKSTMHQISAPSWSQTEFVRFGINLQTNSVSPGFLLPVTVSIKNRTNRRVGGITTKLYRIITSTHDKSTFVETLATYEFKNTFVNNMSEFSDILPIYIPKIQTVRHLMLAYIGYQLEVTLNCGSSHLFSKPAVLKETLIITPSRDSIAKPKKKLQLQIIKHSKYEERSQQPKIPRFISLNFNKRVVDECRKRVLPWHPSKEDLTVVKHIHHVKSNASDWNKVVQMRYGKPLPQPKVN